MAKFMVKALVITALVCLAVDLAASAGGVLQDGTDLVQQVAEDVGNITTPPPSNTLKDKFKGFVSSVKEGASDAYESVSDSVSDAAHRADEKRKEVVASTKKLVNSAIDKIKNTFKQGEEEHEVPRMPEAVDNSGKVVVDSVKDFAEKAKAAVKSEQQKQIQ